MNQHVHYIKSDDSMEDGSTLESLSMNTERFYDEIRVTDRFATLLKKYSYPIIAALAVLSVILVVTTSVLINLQVNNDSKNSNESMRNQKIAASPFYNKIIYIDSNQIKAYDLKSKNNTILKEVKNEILALEVVGETIYWIEKDLPAIRSLSGSKESVTFSRKLKPQAMAFDYTTEKFYVVDKLAGTINVLDREGKYHGIVLSDIEKPHDIVIDTQAGVMFISQHLKSISRANLDGSNVTVIVPDTRVVGIALDHEKKIILWVDEKNGISCSDYEGKDQRILTESPVSIKSLSFFGNQLFWLLPAYMNRNASLWSCKLNDGICKDYKSYDTLYLRNPTSINIYSGQDVQPVDNPCRVNNGNCSDLCLIIPDNKRSCACRVGYQLNLDLQFCRHTTEFMIYVEDRYARGIVLNPKQKEASNDAIIPTPIITETSASNLNGAVVDFEYDLLNDNFYFTDGRKIYVTSLVTDNDQKVVVSVKRELYIIDLAFDWLSSNLYYSTDTINGVENRIAAVTRDRQNNFIEKTIDVGNDSYQCPHSLLVDANRGYLFFSRCDAVFYENFHRKNVNGSQIKNLHQFGQQKELEIFALDHDEERIYYFDASKHFMYHADFDFNDIQSPNTYITMDKISNFYVYKEHIYLTDSLNIWRLDKLTGTDKVHLVPKFENNSKKKISAIKIVSVAAYSKNIENLCAKNNGDCDQFCFARPRKNCGCVDSKQLQTNFICA